MGGGRGGFRERIIKENVGFKKLLQQPTKNITCYLSTLSFKDMCCSTLAVGSCEVGKIKLKQLISTSILSSKMVILPTGFHTVLFLVNKGPMTSWKWQSLNYACQTTVILNMFSHQLLGNAYMGI